MGFVSFWRVTSRFPDMVNFATSDSAGTKQRRDSTEVLGVL